VTLKDREGAAPPETVEFDEYIRSRVTVLPETRLEAVVDGAWEAHVASNVWAVKEELLGEWLESALTISAEGVQVDGGPRVQNHDGVAVIPLHGVISPQPSLLDLLFGAQGRGLAGFMSDLEMAALDDDVHSIVMDINSPGGLVDGVPEAADKIAEIREGSKRIVAVANTTAASAAYWLASQADEVVVTKSGQVGSIGVYSVHRDMSEAYAKEGVRHTIISAGKYKLEGSPYAPMDDEAKQAAQAAVNDYYDMFVADIARGRQVERAAVTDGYGQGRLLPADRAVRAGLADRKATLGQVVRELSKPQAERPPAAPMSREDRLRLLDALVASR
jgi:signal peptide peptidase SppA